MVLTNLESRSNILFTDFKVQVCYMYVGPEDQTVASGPQNQSINVLTNLESRSNLFNLFYYLFVMSAVNIIVFGHQLIIKIK